MDTEIKLAKKADDAAFKAEQTAKAMAVEAIGKAAAAKKVASALYGPCNDAYRKWKKAEGVSSELGDAADFAVCTAANTARAAVLTTLHVTKLSQ